MNLKIITSLFLLAFLFNACKSTKDQGSSKVPDKAQKEKIKQNNNEAREIQFQKSFFEGISQKSLGNFVKAKASFYDCISIDHSKSAPHYEIARIDYENGNIPAALIEAKIAVETEPENQWYNKLMADLHFEMANYTEASKYYENAIKIDKSDIDSYFQRVVCLMQINKANDAISVLNNLESIIGVNEQTSLQKHQIYLQLNKTEQAGEELLKLKNAVPDEPRYAGMLGQYYQQIGKTIEAQKIYRELEQKYPEDGMIQLMLADYFLMSGDDPKSYEALTKAFRSPEVLIDQKVGILLNLFEQSQQSELAAQRTTELVGIMEIVHPDEAKTWAFAGDILYVNDQSDAARVKYRKALQLDPSRSLIWQQLIQIDSELADYKAMEQDCKDALELFPTITEFYLYQGIASIQLKKYSEALEPLNIGKELIIDSPALSTQFYSLLGDAYNSLKKYNESDLAYEKALKFDPENVFVLNNFSYYLSLRKVKLDKAFEYSLKVNEIKPDQANFQDTHAWVLFSMERFEEAKVWLEKAMSNGGDNNGVILEHYGDVQFKLGNLTEALNYWNKAKNIGGASKTIDRKITEKKYIESDE